MSNQEIDYIKKIGDLLIEIDPSQGLLELCLPVLTRSEFKFFPAAVKKHHAYYGGLAKHTYEVLRFAIDSVANITSADKTVVAVAAVWHDIGKLTDYELFGVDHATRAYTLASYTTRASQEGHLVISYQWFRNFIAIDAFKVNNRLPDYARDEKWVNKVAHAILGHHGRKEWGSPREPSSIEALAVHQADMMSVMVECGGNPALRESTPVVNVYKGEDLTEGDIITGVLVGANTTTQYVFQRLDKNGCPIVVPAAKPTLDNQVKMPLRCITYIRPPEAYASPEA